MNTIDERETRSSAFAQDLLRTSVRDLRVLRATRGQSRRTKQRMRAASAALLVGLALLGAPPLAQSAAAADPDYCFQDLANPFGLAEVGGYSKPDLEDIDGDGDLDALVGESNGNTIFFRNTGTAMSPAFAAPSTNPFGLVDVDTLSKPDLADIDGDGDLDALIGEHSGNTIFFRNTGTAMAPAFTAPSTNPFGLAGLSGHTSPELEDIDDDGDLDALIGEKNGSTTLFRNTGTALAPAFAAPSANPFGLGNVGGYSTPDLEDIDGDGDLDALIGRGDGNTIFFRNTGTAMAPAFAAPSTNPFGLPDVGGYSTPNLEDIDGDGDLDALIGEVDGSTIFFRNTGTAMAPAFEAPSTFALLADVGGYSKPDLADIDGDGDLDALVGESNGNTILFRNTGTAMSPAFAAPSTNPFGLVDVGTLSKPDLADIDGDGDLDALIGEHSGSTIFFRNTGTAMAPAFTAPSTNPFGLAGLSGHTSPELADIDGDGDLDALIGEKNGSTTLFRNTGTAMAPAFAAPSANPFGLGDVGGYSTPDLVDIDGDGDLDALIGRGDGNTIFFRNTGTAMAPGFAAPSTNPFGLPDVGGYSTPNLEDIDGDGDLDALIGEVSGNTIFFDNGCGMPPVTPTPTDTPADTPTATHTSTAMATCPMTPAVGCATSTKGQLQLRDNADDTKDKLKWKFTGGPALMQSDFGDPLTTASYALCVYDDGMLKLEAQVGPSGTSWKASGSTGYLFSDKTGASDGVTKVKLKGGAAGKSKLQVKGKGANIPMPAPVSGTQFFDNATGVTAQLFEQNGDCYETVFTPLEAIKNDGMQFKAKK